jgi:hypothetical protein
MITMTPKLINMGYSSRYLRVSQRWAQVVSA